MNLRELVLRNRSVRRFLQDRPVDLATLEELVDLARHTASAGNLQPLRYALCADPAVNARIFECLGWAAYLTDWPGPEEGERPAAYIVVCRDAAVAAKVDCDHGIASQTILLGAAEKGLSGCMLASVNRDKLARILDLPESLPILLVLALGRAAEEVVLEEAAPGGDIRYRRDASGAHHVPKRGLGEIIVRRYGGGKHTEHA
ncbi:nitroreductase family protein [Desulfovibrio aminophilus]|nr:nitroreductase family protein [Desulfovibrio aminophilus]MCM0755839.1 nitroreductase family protein [Desulfovibrio aminophilus]